eukprot:9958245-Alexandrium_andersonii.AAC.1
MPPTPRGLQRSSRRGPPGRRLKKGQRRLAHHEGASEGVGRPSANGSGSAARPSRLTTPRRQPPGGVVVRP